MDLFGAGAFWSYVRRSESGTSSPLVGQRRLAAADTLGTRHCIYIDSGVRSCNGGEFSDRPFLAEGRRIERFTLIDS
jgi:hypothetical protein